MTDHLAIAAAFVEELHQTQPSIVAIMLTGSVARGQTAAFSDIDLMIMVGESAEPQVGRKGISTWRDGIYIDAGLTPQSAYVDVERILGDPRLATHFAYGTILYDPTGWLAALQTRVQAQYMQPQWLQVRLQTIASRIESRIEALRAAIDEQDALQICIHTGRLGLSIALLPLLHQGIAPSSTRHLLQLGEVAPEIAAKLTVFEGSAAMSRADVEVAHTIFTQLTALGDTSRWGELPTYMVRKTAWMIQHDLEKAALHTMWLNVGFRVNDCLATPNMADETLRLAHDWLHQTGWRGAPTLATKLEMARTLFDDVHRYTVPE